MTTNKDATLYLMTKSDEIAEKSRLDLQHQVWLLTLHGRLFTPPLPERPKAILDIGCGNGVWAFAMAEKYPDSQVLGTDLTPPNFTARPNLTFLKSNAEDQWQVEGKFTFIHGRMLASGIHDWPALLAQCWAHLEPGGWLELLDLCHPFAAEDPSAESSSAFIRWGRFAEKSWSLSGLDYRSSTKHVERLRQLGFVDIQEQDVKWPLGEWPSTDREKQMGSLTLKNFSKFIEMAGVSILTHNNVLNESEAEKLVIDAGKDLVGNSISKRYYLSMKIHTARKPEFA